MKVAYYSPMPPSRSGIADYSTLLLPELSKRIDVVVAQARGRAGGLRPAALRTDYSGVRSAASFCFSAGGISSEQTWRTKIRRLSSKR